MRIVWSETYSGMTPIGISVVLPDADNFWMTWLNDFTGLEWGKGSYPSNKPITATQEHYQRIIGAIFSAKEIIDYANEPEVD